MVWLNPFHVDYEVRRESFTACISTVDKESLFGNVGSAVVGGRNRFLPHAAARAGERPG
jgi:hypothetical protein